MNVNLFVNNFKSQGLKLLAVVTISVCAILLLGAFVSRSGSEVISRRANIAVRAIGHNLLLRAGDSTSVVPPVIEKSNGVFLLEFENEFVFQPDTLVAIAQRVLDKTGLSKYIVSVHRCDNPEIVYGFEINPPVNSIQTCQGRSQPKACYTIEVAFSNFPSTSAQYSTVAMIISSILSVVSVVVIITSLGARKLMPLAATSSPIENENTSIHSIGKFALDITNQALRIDDEKISLTDKESKILVLLNRNIGHLTLRDDLIQAVWTDEGVITGRSLDMFISKLRKKLSADPDLRITNVHGKGYRLEVVSGTKTNA